jgi:hypothetical protein
MGLLDLVCTGCCEASATESESALLAYEWEESAHVWVALPLTWKRLCDACDLAARIDALLFSLEKPARALALACRDDLDSLPVLADWCEDNGLPASAADLRHLHGLVRCLN